VPGPADRDADRAEIQRLTNKSPFGYNMGMLKIFEEVTEWKGVAYRQPNHVYLMSGDRAYAYSKWGEGRPEYFLNPSRIDRRGRKFVEVKRNRWGFDMKIRVIQDDKPRGETWAVKGSRGDEYTVSLQDGRWSCTCPGAMFRGACRHIAQIRDR